LTMGEYPGPCERSGSETSREGLGSKKGSMGIFPSGHFSFATLGRSFRKISKSSAFSGSVFLSLAQCAFALSGYLVNVGLARFLGPTGYGQYGVTISVLTWLEILLSTGLVTTATKLTAEMPRSATSIVWLTLRYMAVFSVFLFVVSQLLSRPISIWLSDESIRVYLQIAFIDLLFYGFMKVIMGVQNGLRKYIRTSVIVFSYAVSKAVLILGLAGGGLLVKGALVGNFLATIVGIGVGFLLTRGLDNHTVDRDQFRYAARITLPSTVWAVSVLLLMSTDLWVAKAMIGGKEIGYYVAAATLARLIYVLSTGVRIIVLPEVSSLLANGAHRKARRSIMQLMMGFLPILLGMAIGLQLFSEQIIVLVFSETYRPAAPILRWMGWGYLAITYCEFFARGLTALGKVWHSAMIFLVLSLSSVPVHVLLVREAGILGAVYGFCMLAGIGALGGCIALFSSVRAR